MWGVASVLGPVLGGFFAGADQILGVAGWRWIFLMNVPLGAATMCMIMRVLHLPVTHKRVPDRLLGRRRADRGDRAAC